MALLERESEKPTRRGEYLAKRTGSRHDETMSSRALANFLRDRRTRISPSDVGLREGSSKRRTPGLRREEVAARSRMSTVYYTQLEQARGANPSQEMLHAMATALLLSRGERAHLFHLAGETPPPDRKIPNQPPESLLALLDRLTDTAVVVVDAKQDIIAWNALAAVLLGDCARSSPMERNFARRFFLHPDPDARHFKMTQAKSYGRFAAAELRAAAARYPGDADLTDLIAELRSNSAHFERLWQSAEVAPPHSVLKKMLHPTAGLLSLRCDTLLVPELDQRAVFWTAKPKTRTARILRELAANVAPAERGTRTWSPRTSS